jgi:hypothetical protein
MQQHDVGPTARDKRTPQGSPISAFLANLFLHYAFDTWMTREHARIPFERYADDIVAHRDCEQQDRALQAAVAEQLAALGLQPHPDKTKVVHCEDANRAGVAEHTSFEFLGYTFRARLAKGRRGFFASFSPAISASARKVIGTRIRGWHLRRCRGSDLTSIAVAINPRVRGWFGYYGAFYRSELVPLALRIGPASGPMRNAQVKRVRGQKRWCSARRVGAWVEVFRG